MAATTSGWQWPVEVTAMPAEKSRNSLPSTSSITTPRPRLATSGYERVYDGEMARASSFTMRAAFGPGSLVLMTGPTVLVIVVIVFSSKWLGRAQARVLVQMENADSSDQRV